MFSVLRKGRFIIQAERMPITPKHSKIRAEKGVHPGDASVRYPFSAPGEEHIHHYSSTTLTSIT